MRVLIDTNVVLDIILGQEPFVDTATTLFALVESGRIQGYIAATTITNIFYIVRKLQGRDVALQAIAKLMLGLNFWAVNFQVIQRALALNLHDFADGVQLACAFLDDLDVLVTRDASDFQGVDFTVLSTTDFISQLTSGD